MSEISYYLPNREWSCCNIVGEAILCNAIDICDRSHFSVHDVSFLVNGLTACSLHKSVYDQICSILYPHKI